MPRNESGTRQRLTAGWLLTLWFGAAMLTAVNAQTPSAQATVSVYAAGSLREAMTAFATAHEAATGTRVVLSFGASGLLRERIEAGEPAEVFASADTEHPQRLANAGRWQAPSVFARNTLCALAVPGLKVAPNTLLDTLLRSDVRIGTSTPKADPSGDYAWELFRRAEALRPGALDLLDAKALKLTGGKDSPKAPPGRNTYAWVMTDGQADVFLTYCTNAVTAQREAPTLQIVAIPAQLQVGAAYGLTLRQDATPAAAAFAKAVLSPQGQAMLQGFGFAAP